ncbi:hypothetical protein ACTWQB_11460 [Piscibacillus sp. B03]|uniref:hypothetical protein n=1 Tax=Piscibacillus sp. B03 TaxID=3457430 RepID=UPI003FCCF2E3
MKHFYNADDIADLLQCSQRTAYYRIQQMNKELEQKGYYIEQGKIPILYFHEKYPYIPKTESEVKSL